MSVATARVQLGARKSRSLDSASPLLRKDDAPLGMTRKKNDANVPGRFGVYGGRYVPETLMAALEELEREYERAKRDPKFRKRLDELLRTYAGRPTALTFARRLTQKLGGAKIYLKREDLLHTGAHKINNCLGQGAAGGAHGQAARDCRDWGGAAWRGYGYRLRAARFSNAWSTWAPKTCGGRS